MPRKQTKRSLTLALDRMASQKARERAGGLCECCGKQATQVHHVHSRRFRRLRWDQRNLIAVCASCHRFAHDRPAVFMYWFMEHRRSDWVFLSDPENTKPMHITLTYLKDLHEEMKAA